MATQRVPRQLEVSHMKSRNTTSGIIALKNENFWWNKGRLVYVRNQMPVLSVATRQFTTWKKDIFMRKITMMGILRLERHNFDCIFGNGYNHKSDRYSEICELRLNENIQSFSSTSGQLHTAKKTVWEIMEHPWVLSLVWPAQIRPRITEIQW